MRKGLCRSGAALFALFLDDRKRLISRGSYCYVIVQQVECASAQAAPDARVEFKE